MDPLATASIIYLVKCGFKKSKCRSNCSCRSHDLSFSEMYICDADEEGCYNVSQEPLLGIDDDKDVGDPLI